MTKCVSGLAAIAAVQQGSTLRTKANSYGDRLLLHMRGLYEREYDTDRWPRTQVSRMCDCSVLHFLRDWEVV